MGNIARLIVCFNGGYGLGIEYGFMRPVHVYRDECENVFPSVPGSRLASKNLSRAVEDSATVTANLVPWNSGGAYQAATLGVATLAYLPFAFFCWLSPIVTLIYGIFGITIHKIEDDPETVLDFVGPDEGTNSGEKEPAIAG